MKDAAAHAKHRPVLTASKRKASVASAIAAVDVFCGAGGLTYGFRRAGIDVKAGIDIDEQAGHAFAVNNPGTSFFRWDVGRKHYTSIAKLFDGSRIRLLAGCAPCQPFSKLTNGRGRHRSWGLLDHFGRFVERILPELVTMENVPELSGRGSEVFGRFLRTLEKSGYKTDWRIVDCADYGVPQSRRRLVLLASRLGVIAIPELTRSDGRGRVTVRSAIATLPPLEAGETDPEDPLHSASVLSDLNLRRLRATPADGGTRDSWPDDLVLDCHRRRSGRKYVSIYGRMFWDRPAPTMTTLCTGIGNGRFGHPEQDRAISLREAALLQSFPPGYEFWPRGERLNRKAIARLIGNAVPPMLSEKLGRAIIDHVKTHLSKKDVG